MLQSIGSQLAVKLTWCIHIIQGLITSFAEVCALCGFVFGVACKLPPSLTILILNGCFCCPIGCYLTCKAIKRFRIIKNCSCFPLINSEETDSERGSILYLTDIDQELEPNSSQETATEQQESKKWKSFIIPFITTTCETFGFIIQLSVLASIPILLSMEQYFSPSGRTKHNVAATCILIPVSLILISVVWSGWVQDRITKATGQHIHGRTARYKTGNNYNLLYACYELFIVSYSYIHNYVT